MEMLEEIIKNSNKELEEVFEFAKKSDFFYRCARYNKSVELFVLDFTKRFIKPLQVFKRRVFSYVGFG